MKERGMLFNGPMVRALLDGSKTQTRRVVKDLPPWEITEIFRDAGGTSKWMPNGPAPSGRGMAAGHWRLCPYGQPGDRLWVRETFAKTAVHQAGGASWTVYRECDNRTDYGGPWTPSIHMPRAASRITLEIVSVRVERLNEITLGDICKEGLARSIYDFLPATDGFRVYRELWQSINGAKSWAANPWVWVINFRRISA